MADTLTIPVVSLEAVRLATKVPLGKWHVAAHQVCLDLVRSGLFPYARVVQGTSPRVHARHFWLSLSEDVYDKYATLVDPTLWCHDPSLRGVWVGTLEHGIHHPLGIGYLWDHTYPENSSFADTVTIPKEGLSTRAKYFLSRVEPLNRDGWAELMRSPMQGWPSGEIIDQMKHTPELSDLVPEALEGMLTNRDPNGAWLGGRS